MQKAILGRILGAADRRATIVLGPRQVGKTVLLRQLAVDGIAKGWPAPNVLYFDFSDDRLIEVPSPRDVLALEPEGFDPSAPRILLLDEIGRSERWDLWLKQAVDATRGHRLVATDSSATLLRDGGSESGQGRWDELVLEPLTYSEFLELQGIEVRNEAKQPRDMLELYLERSGFPEHLQSEDFRQVRERLRLDIAEMAILSDLSHEGVDVTQVLRLFVTLVQDSGAVFEAANRAGDLKVSAQTIREWKRLLLRTCLLQALTPFQSPRDKAGKRLAQRPKVFAADHGLVFAFSPTAQPREVPDLMAKAWETIVYRHLREAARELQGTVAYYRNHDTTEVDFVLALSDRIVALEVTQSVDPKDKISKLARAGEELGARQMLLLYGGQAEERRGAVQLVPLRGFLMRWREILMNESV